jgi:hypothetical protein
MPNRRLFNTGLSAAAASLLSSCGTILYPDRAYQKERGTLDPAIAVLDGIGLLFGIIPGLVAFAVDFTTGAIYFPAGHEPGDEERTIFDQVDAEAKLDKREIERILALHTGINVDLNSCGLRTMRIASLHQFGSAYMECTGHSLSAVLPSRGSMSG